MSEPDEPGATCLLTVRRVRDAAAVAHRCTRAFSLYRSSRGIGPAVGWLAYPIIWLGHFTQAGLHASSTVHHQVASMKVANPVSRPPGKCRPVLAVVALIGLGYAAWIVIAASMSWWLFAATVLGLAALWFAAGAELLAARRLNPSERTLGETEQLVRRRLGERELVVRGSAFAAWPTHTGAGRELLRAVLDELARDRVSLLVSARTDEVAGLYVDRFGGTRPNPHQPRHIAWLAPAVAS